MSKGKWEKEFDGVAHYNKCLRSKTGRVQTFFNWRPASVELCLSLSIHKSGLTFEIGAWFHWTLVICFFDPRF
jgi:hypothetical protein